MSVGQIIGATIAVGFLLILAGIGVDIGQAIAPHPTHFTDCHRVLEFVDGRWRQVWVCR